MSKRRNRRAVPADPTKAAVAPAVAPPGPVPEARPAPRQHEKQRRSAQRARTRSRRRFLVSLGGAALFGAGAFLFLRPADAFLAVGPQAAYAAPVMGEPTAPVTVVWYSDFQCPFCAAWSRSVEPEFIKRYVDTGKAKLVMKNFQVRGPESRTAAQAAACAGEQGKFWQYHDFLYAHQRGENSGAFSSGNLKGFAPTLGLDTAAFGQCLDSGRYRAAIDADLSEGRGLGVTATPTFIINGGQRIVGAQPIEAFARVIDPLVQR